ncbi:MAG: hypothetical protein WAV09_01235 [Minisyncoccia bacterium]
MNEHKQGEMALPAQTHPQGVVFNLYILIKNNLSNIIPHVEPEKSPLNFKSF